MKNELKSHTNNSLIKFSKIFPSNKFTSLYDKKEDKLISKLFKQSKSKPKPSLSSYQSDFTSTSLHTENPQSHSITSNTQQLDKINTLYNELNLTSPHQNKSPNGAYINHKESLTTNEELLPQSSIENKQNDKVIQRSISKKTISIPKLGMNVFQNENNNITINKDYFTACVTNRNRNKTKCLDDDSYNSNIFLNKTEDNHNSIKYTSVTPLCNEIKTITIIKPSTPEIHKMKPNSKIPKQHSSSTCNKQLFKLKQRIQETIIKYKCKPKSTDNSYQHTNNNTIHNCKCKCNCYSEMDSLLTELSNILELN